ncbi:hypothetical protein MHBO_002236 [Bonamia ostreae]|uniref:Uncharacterized protein n=1 Tax=Bonamia ostreae TaxID=126728 RepID=A0ABV2AMA5_9EUKA
MFAIFFESAILIRSGLYGSFDQLGIGNIVIIASQLCLAGIVVLLLDEMLEKGYGLGSGISLFIATNVCESIFWNCFSPTTLHTAKGIQFEGAVVEVLHVGLRSDRSLKRLFSVFSLNPGCHERRFSEHLQSAIDLRRVLDRHLLGGLQI